MFAERAPALDLPDEHLRHRTRDRFAPACVHVHMILEEILPSAEGSVPSFVEKEKWRNLLLTKHIAQRGEGGLRRAEGYHD